MPLSIQPPKPLSFSCLSVCILHFPASKGLQFCALWCPDCQPWCHCWKLSNRWRKPPILGEKPSLSLCSHSPSSASHINTGITHMGILSALLGWFVHWKLWKCSCTLLNRALIHLNYMSPQHYGSRVKKTKVSLLILTVAGLYAVLCCFNQPPPPKKKKNYHGRMVFSCSG